ncbi:MAG: hypothetical protein RI924_1052 [Bacteroidota bacterium]|jgi:penicillin-binding protein 1A
MFREIKNKRVRYFSISLYFLVLFFCAMELNFLWMFGSSPTIKDIKTPSLQLVSELYTADGKLIGRYFRENRIPVEYEEIAPSVVDALVATEDIRFYEHSGIDMLSLVSSTVSTAKGDKRGGSTITQQLAKNLYSTRGKKSQGWIKYIPVFRTVVYKLKEWISALKLESYHSKNDILTLYLNTVPFGNNAYGIKIAAKRYFSKEPGALKVDEAAMLIGMLKATSTYNPFKNPEKCLDRRNVVLTQLVKYNFLGEKEAKKYLSRPLRLKPTELQEVAEGDSYIRGAVARYLEEWCEDNDYDLYVDGLKIYTTIDSKLQQYAEEAVESQMKTLQRRFQNVWGNENPWRDEDGNELVDFPEKAAQRLPCYDFLKKKFDQNQDSIDYYLNKPKKMKVFSWEGEKEVEYSTMDSIKHYAKMLNTGVMTLDPFNGHVKVWVGGINHKYFKYDHVDQAKRQAGSTFKPFAYLAALEQGMNPCDKYIDKPVKIVYQENGKTETWEPKNADFEFSGREMSLRWAMGKSVNSITAQITEKVGWENVVKAAQQCGIESPLESVPSVSLGANDVSVFEMVKSYGTFLNKGIKTDPILVQRIEDNDGITIAKFKAKQERAISEEIAWLMLYMFRGSMEEPGGTSQALWEWDIWKEGNQIGGKTGTSSDYVDGWYMGISKDLVTGIWVGCDDRSIHFKTSETGEGSRTALPIYGKFMEKVLNDPSTGIKPGRFPKPGVPITRSYQCESPRIMADSTQTDSLLIDSTLSAPAEGELPTTENTTGTPSNNPVKIPVDSKTENKPKKKDQL